MGGFTLSPVLWRKLPGSRSAGRVQSVALRLICERETEIEKFKAEEYWTIDAELLTAKKALIKSRLIELDGKKLEKFDLNSEEKALEAKAKIEAQNFAIYNIERKKANRYPAPPFTTSTLQQEAARKLRFSAKKTMQIAQKLYEEGLITYMRTDAVNLSADAIKSCREAILKYFGEAYLPKEAKEYKKQVTYSGRYDMWQYSEKGKVYAGCPESFQRQNTGSAIRRSKTGWETESDSNLSPGRRNRNIPHITGQRIKRHLLGKPVISSAPGQYGTDI